MHQAQLPTLLTPPTSQWHGRTATQRLEECLTVPILGRGQRMAHGTSMGPYGTKKHVQARPRSINGRDDVWVNDDNSRGPPRSAYAGRTQSKKAKELLLQQQADSWEMKPHRHGGFPTMYYPETAKNATNVYVEREKHQAGAFGRGFERPLSNHQKNRGTPTGNPSRLHSQRKTEARNSVHRSVQNPGRKPGLTIRKARARKQKKTAQLSLTAQPFTPTTSRQFRDINTASVPEPTKTKGTCSIRGCRFAIFNVSQPGLRGQTTEKTKDASTATQLHGTL